MAPYFYDDFYPEGYVLRAIAYYYNCQWDRVQETLQEANSIIEPLVQQSDALLQQDYDAEEWFTLFQNRCVQAQMVAKISFHGELSLR